MFSSSYFFSYKTNHSKLNSSKQSVFKSILFSCLAIMLLLALPREIFAASPFPPSSFSLLNKVVLRHSETLLEGTGSSKEENISNFSALVFSSDASTEESAFNLSPTKTGVGIIDNVKSEKIDYSDPNLNLTGSDKRRQYLTWFAESFANWDFKYKLGGTDIQNGIDCSAFVKFVFNYFDTPVNRTSGELFNSGIATDLESAKPGDLVFFGKKNIEHVAIVTKNDKTGLWVVHSTTSKGIIKENISESPYWLNKIRNKAVNIIGSHTF